MFFWPSEQEGRAWLEACDESWADRAGQAYSAAAARRDDGEPEQDPAP
jgi:hypothetical protein